MEEVYYCIGSGYIMRSETLDGWRDCNVRLSDAMGIRPDGLVFTHHICPYHNCVVVWGIPRDLDDLTNPQT